jgi:cancer susceptibility candidate protein 1
MDYPYLKWKLRCIGNDRARLDITSKRDTFKFEINPGCIMLIDKKE